MKIKARQGYGYTLSAEKCDKCHTQGKTVSEDYRELNRLNRADGWIIEFDNGKQIATCPECARREAE